MSETRALPILCGGLSRKTSASRPLQAVRWDSTFLLTSNPINLELQWAPNRAHTRFWSVRASRGLLLSKQLWFLPGMPLQTFIVEVNSQFLGAQRAQLILRQHSQDSFPQHPIRSRRAKALRRHFLQPPGKTAMVAIHLLFQLVSGQPDLVRINNHNVIATVQIRCIVRLVLADQYSRHARGNTAHHLSRGVQDKPPAALLDHFSLPSPGYIRAHVLSHTFPCRDKRKQ